MAITEQNVDGLIYMTAENLAVRHAFTTRHGGVSEGIFASLNLGENRGDDPNAVSQNYDILCGRLGFPRGRMVFSRQVHGVDVRRVTAADTHTLFAPVPYEADALITNEESLPLVIFTADCIPILLHDPVTGSIGAAHAGWRGTVMDIAGITVRKMQECFGAKPEDITAAIGPGISVCCFETDAEVPEAVMALLGDAAGAYITEKDSGKAMVDLKGVNYYLLERAGVKNIDISDECTMCMSDKYWSHRHTAGERGSQASIIMLGGVN